MPRFYVAPEACGGSRITLGPAEALHATRVLRLGVGADVTVLDGQGRRLECEILAVEKRAVSLRVCRTHTESMPQPRLTLVQSVLKARPMDWLIQKATELGVTRIVPVLTERTVPDFPSAEAGRKRAKWETVAIEALKQCGLPWLPQIEPPQPLARFLEAGFPGAASLVGALTPQVQRLRTVLETRFPAGSEPGELGLWLGPEGDFTEAELAAIQAAGAFPVSLGPRVLRSETASITMLAVLNEHFGR